MKWPSFKPAAKHSLLLLAWDIAGMQAVVAQAKGAHWTFGASASSRQADFAAALDEIMAALKAQGAALPARAALACRQVLPFVADLPVSPASPRPAAQMRELLRAEAEAVQAEFGGLWSFGALLQARGHLSAQDRERVGLEDELRQQSGNTPLRFGETALHMGLVERGDLDECLFLQERLQSFGAEILTGWVGYLDDKQACWLACAAHQGAYQRWREALAARKLQLVAVAPLLWLMSEGAPDAAARRIDVELHAEETVAILRVQGRVRAARAESRLERPLQSDWLARLVESASDDGARIPVNLYSLHPQPGLMAVREELEAHLGTDVAARDDEHVLSGLWRALAETATAAQQARLLPRLAEQDMREPLWKNPDMRRVAALLGVSLALGAVEIRQQVVARQLENNATQRIQSEKSQAQSSSQQSRFNAELAQLGKDLEKARNDLAPLLNEKQRLDAIVAMRRNLPDLLRSLAQAVGDDAVLESLHNSRSGGDVGAIKVSAWSPSYTGAQNFVGRMSGISRASGYGVSQTEIVETRGRNERVGHAVAFWLLPEDEEMDADSSEKAAP